MPLIHTVVEPKFLSRKELDKSYENELEAVTNNTLVAILKQLSCIVRCASRIFDSVGDDLQTISCRSQRLKDRIKNVEEVVTSLNAKSETIVCDLRAYSQVKQHYVSSQPQKRELFLPENRPHHISSLYDNAVISLVHIMREIDQYREDGCRSSKYFICTPVFKDKSVDLEIETRRPASLCTARDWQSDDELGIPEVCQDKEDEDDDSRQNHLADDILRLPSPEERTHALSLKYPYSDVPIDVTGSGFQRMASFRRSLIQVEFFTRKKKKKGKSGRRNTISGGISKDQIGDIIRKSEKKNGFFHNSLSKKFTLANFNNYDGNEDDKISPDSTLKRPPSVSKGVQTTDENTEGESGPSKEKTENKKTIKSKLKSYIPISTLSQAMTVAVKLRDNAKSTDKIDDGGQSSSGNWSASSSTRASMESDNTRLVNSPELVRSSSQTSLSKDSALSDGTLQVDGARSPDSNCGPLSDTSSPECVKKNNSFYLTKHTSSLKTMKWLHGVNKEGIAGDTTDGTSTTGTLTPVTGKRTFSPFDLPLAFMDDEESSVYSVDADGYYTSMHTDSGLRSSVIVKDDTIEDFPSTQGEESSETLSSHSSATAHEVCVINKLDSKEKGSTKKIPPPPPPRKCTLNKNLVPNKSTEVKGKSFESQSTTESPDQSPSPSSVLESDIDSEFHEKTSINASRIPSMCIVTPSPSDDEGMKSDPNNNNNVKKEILNPLSKVSDYNRTVSSSAATKMSPELSVIGMVATSRPSLQAHENTFKYQANNSPKPQIYSNTTAAAKENSSFRTSTSNSISYSNASIGLSNQKSINSGNEAFQKTSPEDSFMANGTVPGSRSDFNKKYFMHNNSQATPLIPLKYAQHITITPGARKIMPNPNRSSFFSTIVGEMETAASVGEQSTENKCNSSGNKDVDRYYSLSKSPITNGENDSVSTASYASTKSSTSVSNGSSKIIYATNSLEKKKNGSSTNGAQRQGAYVSLDPSGKIIYSTNSLNRKEQKSLTNGHVDSNTSEFNSSSQGTSVCSDSSMHNLEVNKPVSKLTKNSQSELSSLNLENPNRSYRERNYCKYDTNTLPRRRLSSSAPPIPVFPTQNKNDLPYNIGSTHNPTAERGNPSAYSNPNNVVWRYTPSELSSKRDSITIPVNCYQNVQAAKQNSQLSHCNSLRNPYPQGSKHYISQTADNSWRKNSENGTSYLPIPVSRMKPFQSEAEERRKYESPFIPPGNANQFQSTKMGMHSKNIANSNQPTANSQNPTLQSKFTSGIASSLFSKKYNQENSQDNSISYRNFTPPDIYAFHPVSSSTPVPPANDHLHRLHQNDLSPASTDRPSSDYGSFHGKIYGPAEKMGICQSYPSTSYQSNTLTTKNSVISSNQSNNDIRNQFANRNYSYSSTLPNPKTKKDPPAATVGTSRKSTMKTDDLFAKIHESKKRLNIKTDFDRSLSPVSSDGMSRSSSSTSLRSCPQMENNGTPQRMLTPGDRRSWAGSFPLSPSSSNQGTPGNRRSWAMDRLGPSKPTSMHDFKMLLLQAGQGGSNFDRQRISAAEMLKLSSSKQDTNSFPIKKSQATNISSTGKENKNFNFDSPNRNSPTSFRPIFSNGYNSLNRGRNRLNLSHTKTDILSTPIPEDNSEDSDSSDDNKAIGTIV